MEPGGRGRNPGGEGGAMGLRAGPGGEGGARGRGRARGARAEPGVQRRSPGCEGGAPSRAVGPWPAQGQALGAAKREQSHWAEAKLNETEVEYL